MTAQIRRFEPADWPAAWAMLEPVIRGAESYPCPRDMTQAEARRFWIETPAATYVAGETGGALLGTFFIRADQGGPGDHVCNCGYVVDASARGRGLAVEMCLASQEIAREMGFTAMKFNLVVASNAAAIRAWEKCGLRIIGTIPDAYRHARLGLVDAHIMHMAL